MAYTALNVVNAILKRTGVVAGDTTAITSFTDTGHQREIDVALQALNDIIRELYIRASLAGEQAEGTITLVAGSAGREYSLPADFIQMAGKTHGTRILVCAAQSRTMVEYPGGYEQMYADQVTPDNYAGAPGFWAINKATGKIRIDTNPTATEVGDVYTFLYDKSTVIAATTDTFPFHDRVVDAIVAAVAEDWRINVNRETRDQFMATAGFRSALKMLTQTQRPTRYGVSFA